jgi:flagellar hook-associated protein 2
MGIASPGIGSGLQIDDLISKLMAVESQPLAALAKKEAAQQAKVAAYGALSGALTSFKNALSELSSASSFRAVTAKPADDTILKSTATSQAVAGNYAVNVTQLAQAQTIMTGGQKSATAPIGDGGKTTLTFEFGKITGGKLQNGVYVNDPGATPPSPAFTEDASQAVGTVVIDNTNNSLQGMRDAINKANIGVTATIVSDGSDNPYHLVLTSNATGETSSMKITVTRDASLPADSTLANLLGYDPAGTQNLTQTAVAQDSKLTVNGIAVSAKSKSVTEAIQGVTLELSKIGTTSVAVARDVATVEKNVNGFIKAYNELNKTVQNLTAYDAEKKSGGPLVGDSSARGVMDQMRALVGGYLPNASGPLKNLMAIGVGFQRDGSLALDSSKFQKAIASNFDDVASLFASAGSATDSFIKFAGNSSLTKAGTSTVYVTSLATRGQVVGGAAPATTTVTAGVNDQLNVTIGDISTSVTLTAANYTPAGLAVAMQSAINGASELVKAGLTVNVTVGDDGKITIANTQYGKDSKIDIGGSAADSFLPSKTATAGTDAVGTINGVEAKGSGQFLTSGDGLKIEVTGGPVPAERGTVSFSRGFAELASDLITSFTGKDGMVTSRTDGINEIIKTIGKQRDALGARLAGVEKRYRAQFTALDVSVARMKSTSDYLAQQLASLAAQTRSN